MGASSGKKKLAGRSAAFVLAASLLSGCTGSVIEQFNSVSSGDCITANDNSYATAEQRDLQNILQTVRQTRSGAHIMGYSERDSTKFCFNDAMRGSSANARYYHWANRADITPKEDIARIAGSVVHEARHKQQYAMGIRWQRGANVPLAERTLMKELIEADARLAAIVYAYEMKAKGQGQYMRALKKDNLYRGMANAFERHIARSPGDMLGAMRAGMMQFRADGYLRGLYGREVRETFREHDPKQRIGHVLSPSVLRKLGHTAYGNYMNDQMVSFFMNGARNPAATRGLNR